MSFRWLTLTVMLVGLVFAALAFAVLRVSTIAPRTSLYAFYVDWDSSSYLSLSNNIASISTLVPEWYHLGADGTLSRDNPDTEARTMALIGAKRPGLRITPIVNDLDKATGQWDSNAVARMLRDPAQRAKIADEIVSAIHRRGFQGVNIDFEGLPVSSKDDLTAFMAELHDRAQPLGLEVTQDVALSDSTFDLPALANNVDYLIPMMYDEHWSTSGAGPIASQPWFEDGLATLFKEVPPAKVIVAYGDYGFEWRNGTANAKTLSFAEAIATARSAGVPVTLDATSLNPTF
jgi:spore germination protein YaaH